MPSWYRLIKRVSHSSNLLRKTAATLETMPYFQEFAEDGEYVPDVDNVARTLQQKFRAKIVSTLGQGDSGVAYKLSNGDVLKVTTNASEGRIAQWLVRNPHPNIARYKDVWKDGDLYYEVMEFVNTSNDAAPVISRLSKALDNSHCYDPDCAVKVLSDMRYRNIPHISEILSVLNHVSRIPGSKPFDLLNINNIGQGRDGSLKFFDIT